MVKHTNIAEDFGYTIEEYNKLVDLACDIYFNDIVENVNITKKEVFDKIMKYSKSMKDVFMLTHIIKGCEIDEDEDYDECEEDELTPMWSEGVKPCHTLEYCPYGKLVEDFEGYGQPNYMRCDMFGHLCPVYYVAEPMVDFMDDPEEDIRKFKRQMRNKFNRMFKKKKGE